MKNIVLLALAFLWEWMGVNAFFRFLNWNNVKILLYHGVTDEQLPATLNVDSLHVPRHKFAQHIAHLKRHYQRTAALELRSGPHV